MRKSIVSIVAMLAALTCVQAWALDAIRRLSGPTVSGTITKMTATEVTVEKKVGGSESVPVADIDEVSFDAEPTQLKTARRDIDNGAFDSAVAVLDRIDQASLSRSEIQADVQFYKALCQAKMALAGSGDPKVAGKAMSDFITRNPSNFHFLDANELVGDLLVKLGNYEAARPYYSQLDKSPFPEYKARAGIALGRSSMAEKKFAAAVKQIDAVLALGSVPDSLKLAATLGKADCLAQEGKADEGIKMVMDVISKADAEDASIMAQAYLTLGNCYLAKPNSQKDALMAYLHVDVLYFSQPQAHAAALVHLAKLWNDLNKPERAAQVSQTLKERYGISGN